MQLSPTVYAFFAATGFLATGVFFATGFLTTFVAPAVLGLSALTFFEVAPVAAFFGLSVLDFFGAAAFGLLGAFFTEAVTTDLVVDFFIIFLAGDLVVLSLAVVLVAFLILAAGGALAFLGVFLPAAALAAFGFFFASSPRRKLPVAPEPFDCLSVAFFTPERRAIFRCVLTMFSSLPTLKFFMIYFRTACLEEPPRSFKPLSA